MKKIIITFFIFSAFNVVGQPFANSHDDDYKKNNGYIVLNNGEKINGKFQYGSYYLVTDSKKFTLIISSPCKILGKAL